MVLYSYPRCNNYRYIVICSDCQEVISLLKQEKVHTDIYAHALSVCRELKKEFRDARFEFVKREENQVADSLAKNCRSSDYALNVLRVLSLPPSFCNDKLVSDCYGCFKP